MCEGTILDVQASRPKAVAIVRERFLNSRAHQANPWSAFLSFPEGSFAMRSCGVGFLVIVAGFMYASSPAWADSVAPPSVAQADTVTYGRCAHPTNPAIQTLTPFAVTPVTWPQSRSRTDKLSRTVMEVTPCR